MTEQPVDATPLIMPPGRDEAPPATGPTCETCGVELVYAGRGRPPRRCPEHRKERTKTRITDAPIPTAPTSLGVAGKAARVLGSYNGIVAIGLHIAGLPETSKYIVQCNPTFEEQVAAALASDEKLAKRILGSGQTTALAGLAFAYGPLAFTAVMMARAELRKRNGE